MSKLDYKLIEKNDIEYIKFSDGKYKTLCNELNSFFENLSNKKISQLRGLGVWIYTPTINEIPKIENIERSLLKNDQPFHPSIRMNNQANLDFINQEINLIKETLIEILIVANKKFNLNLNKRYKFSIDLRNKRSPINIFHKDGNDKILFFIYPKKKPIASCIGKNMLDKTELTNQNRCSLGVLTPEVKQCDAIMIENQKVTHCTDCNYSEESNEETNLAFIRISLIEIPEKIFFLIKLT